MKLRRLSLGTLVFFPAVAAMLYACSGDDTTQPPGGDAGPDVTTDAKVDAKVDGGGDATTDGGGNSTSKQIQDVRNAATPVVVDAGTDAGSDATVSDAALEAAVSDAATEAAVSDAATEAGVDGGGGIPVNNLPIDNAIVTYVRPAVGTDPAGFFLQGEKAGPAIFVAIDPTTLSPAPVAGDQVSLKVTAVANVAQLREIVALTGWTRTAQGKDLTALLQDLSPATDPITNLDGYESEYIKLTATSAAAFGTAGAGSVSAQVTTNGVGSPNTNLRVRLPATVQDSLDLSLNCNFTVTGAMWRFNAQAQPSGWVDGDVSGIVCPAPTVLSAAATNATTVVITFDRKIDSASLLGNGSQFAVNNGLTVSAAALTGPRQVTLTTISQTPLQPYTVTVATTLKDTKGKAIGVTGNTANFNGFVVPAVVRLNELNPNITGGLDLIELRVVTAGNLTGITIEENLVNSKVVLATLPALQVALDDLVVVHLNPPVAVTDETNSKTGCTDATCYAGAWDVRGAANGMTFSGRVIVAKAPGTGTIQDGISWFRTGAAPSATWYLETNALAAASQWVNCNGNACVDNTGALAISVDSNGALATPAGASVRRVSNTDTNAKADWAVGASSFGAANP